MKKFLTVLLALSVVFTYTVGSAFAAVSAGRDVTTEAAKKVESELTKVKAAETLYLGGLNPVPSNEPADKGVSFVDINLKRFAVADAKKVTANVIADAENDLNKLYASVIAGKYESDDQLDVAIASITASDYYGADKFQNKVNSLTKLADYELQYAKERYTALVNAVDPLNYSDKVDENGDSNRSKVVALKADTVKKIDDAQNAYKAGGAREVANDFLVALEKINTITDDSYDVADLAAAKEIAIAKVTAAYAEQKADALAVQNQIIRENERITPQTDATRKAIADAKEAIEAINEQYPAALQLMTDQIKALEKVDDTVYYAGGAADTNGIGTIKNYKYTYNVALSGTVAPAALVLAVKKVNKIDELKADAELAKQFIGIEGSKYYSVEEVEIALENAVKKVYPVKDSSELKIISIDAMTPAEALQARIDALIGEGDKAKAKVVIDNKAYETVKAWTDAVAAGKYDYNGSVDTKDAINELAKDTKAALKEVTSIADAEKVFLDAYAKFDAFVTKAEYDEMYAAKGALYEKATKYSEQIKAAVAAKHQIVDASGKYNFDSAPDKKFADNLIAEMKKATTVADLDAKYAEAIAVIDNLKTVDALTAEAKAINDKALAIKAPVTPAQKAEVTGVMDEYAAFKDYVALIDCNKVFVLYDARVKGYLQTIANDEAKAINDAIKAVGTVTVEDKAAVEKIIADKEALDQLVKDYELTATTPAVGDVDALETALSNAEIEAVKIAIAKMEMTMSKENVAKIRDLQKAYNALKTSQKAAITGELYDKYIALGKLANKYEINSTESLKLSVSTKLYKKSNKIRVNWKVKDGDASYIDGYQVYKSTKAQKNYKFMGKTKKSYMDNKKNLKKGTRYFYKVRAYVEIDGQKYYSDWSNKGNRIYK